MVRDGLTDGLVYLTLACYSRRTLGHVQQYELYVRQNAFTIISAPNAHN